METLKKSHSREMDKLKRSSGDGVDGLQTEVVQLQVEMENMSQKYMEEIENLKVCFTSIFPRLHSATTIALVVKAMPGQTVNMLADSSEVNLDIIVMA